MFVHAVEVMLPSRAVNSDTDTQVRLVLLNKPLHFLRVVVDTVGRERETVGVEPMVITAKEFGLDIVAYLVYQVYL